MYRENRNQVLSIILAITCLSMIRCSDPLSEDEAIVRILIDGHWQQGEYVIFWNGKNDKKQYVSPETYYARLYSRDFTHQIEMTGLEGGTGVSNDSSYFDEGFQHLTILKQNVPNPFKIQDGTNIPFTLDESQTIQLTIRDKK